MFSTTLGNRRQVRRISLNENFVQLAAHTASRVRRLVTTPEKEIIIPSFDKVASKNLNKSTIPILVRHLHSDNFIGILQRISRVYDKGVGPVFRELDLASAPAPEHPCAVIQIIQPLSRPEPPPWGDKLVQQIGFYRLIISPSPQSDASQS